MSVELTGAAIDVLSVSPQQKLGAEPQQAKETAEKNKSIESNLTDVTNAEAQNVNDLKNKAENEANGKNEVMTTPQLENVAKQLQEFIGTMNRGLEFTVDEDSGRDVIKVIDKNSGDVIKQYPSEEVLSLVAKLSEATGTFVDSKI